jgi:hypothetical protein
MFDSESENMNTTSNNNNISTINSQAINLIKDLNVNI